MAIPSLHHRSLVGLWFLFGIHFLLMLASVSAALGQTPSAKPAASKPRGQAASKALRKTGTADQKRVPAAKKSETTSKKSVTPARKAAPRKTVATKRKPVRRTTRRTSARAAKPRIPQQPSPARLAEIQDALAKAGYYLGEPSGKWDDTSIDAMKRFQQEHSLPATGKINALSLIALGLGPQRGPAPGSDSVLVPPPPEPPSSPPASPADR